MKLAHQFIRNQAWRRSLADNHHVGKQHREKNNPSVLAFLSVQSALPLFCLEFITIIIYFCAKTFSIFESAIKKLPRREFFYAFVGCHLARTRIHFPSLKYHVAFTLPSLSAW